MSRIEHLFDRNRLWASRIKETDPDFFLNLRPQQNPEFLWIGCADSRVPANQIIDLPPGEVFVHRNIANVVVPSDLNCLSVIQYAVEVLEGEAHHRLRPLRLRRGEGGPVLGGSWADRQLAPPYPQRQAAACARLRASSRRRGDRRPALRAQRHRAGPQCLRHDDRPRRLAARRRPHGSKAGSTASRTASCRASARAGRRPSIRSRTAPWRCPAKRHWA